MIKYFREFRRELYIGIIIGLVLLLGLDYIPEMQFVTRDVTAPMVLFLGLLFAVICGPTYANFGSFWMLISDNQYHNTGPQNDTILFHELSTNLPRTPK